MKRKFLFRCARILAILFLLMQLADVQISSLQQLGGTQALADQLLCSGTVAASRSFSVPGRQAVTVSNDEATLNIDSTVLTATTVLTITPLRAVDLPALGEGMTNVTKGPRCGYRFLPHPARFAGAMQVSIPYNRALIPPGLTDQDVKTFYFDDTSGTWKELDTLAVDTPGQKIISLTDHFTDIINATISLPDSPQPQSNDPTSIKNIKAADPGAGINLIDSPQANSTGDARLSYPIEVPPGRGGMQPQVQVRYSSSGADGWLGVGWDIPMQAVTVDTRWGVPRYDNGQLDPNHPKETETYVLNGEELTPVFNRGALEDRVPDRVFHTRVEGQFNKIVRHGTDPTNYWWEVTGKNGTRSFYGGDPESNGPDADSILKAGNADATGVNIYKWALREVRDLNNNTIRYHYDVVDGGGGSSGEPWHQIYLQSIRYTGTAGTNGSEGPYEITFNREGDRPDATVDGRAGFETRLDQRLASIEVHQLGAPNPMIRRYTFQYQTGEYSKSLLTSVTQYGENGGVFNQHTFDYYDEVASGTSGVLQGFKAPNVNFGDASYVEGGDLLTGDRSTALQANDSFSNQGGLSAGISVLGIAGVGVKGGGQWIGTDTRLTMLDINGDGVLDQVYERPTPSTQYPACSKSYFFRPNTAGPSSTPDFGEEVQLPSLERVCAQFGGKIGHDGSTTWSLNESVHGGPFSATHENQWTETTGDIYMTDVNGDMLPDLVVQKTVYFNHLNNGLPTFDEQSPTPLEGGTTSTAGIVQPLPGDVRAQMESVYHLVDPVRKWTAPYNGTVSIGGEVHLLAAAPDSYSAADGVRVSVQKNGSELWSTTIDDSQNISPRSITGLTSVPVNKGDRIYFRVNSRDDGRFDAVAFDPTITYTGVDTTKVDENGMPVYVYSANSDYAYGGIPLDAVAPITGTATLSGTLQKDGPTSDDVTLIITKGNASVYQQTLAWNQTGSFPVSVDLSTVQGDRIRVRLDSDSRIDLTHIHFVPRMVYHTIMGEPAPVDADGNPVVVLNPALTGQVYPQNLAGSAPYQPWVVPTNLPAGNLQVEVRQVLTVTNPSIPITYSTNVALEVKGLDGSGAPQRLAKQRVDVRNGVISGTNGIDAYIPVTRGQKLYFEVDATTPDSFVMATLSQLDVTVHTLTQTISYNNLPYDVHAGIPTNEAFGGGFRDWWFGQYNGLNAILPINETQLRLPVDQYDDAINYFVQMIPFPDEDLWRMQDPDAWISADQMSATRIGRKNLDVDTGLGGGQAILRMGGAANEGASFTVPFVGGSGASGTNWSQVDFLDFNGDNYPDVVGNGKVQSTLPNGALTSAPATVPGCSGDCSKVRLSKSESVSVNVGNTVSHQFSNSQGELQGITSNDVSFGISAGATGSTGNFQAQWDLVDINGDGLPDLVRQGDPGQNQNGLQVQLNLGYRFGAVEEWGVPATECTALLPTGMPQFTPDPKPRMRCEKSISVGVSVGVGGSGQGNGFGFSLGAGASDNLSMADAQQDLVDVNGDGLVDLVSKHLSLAPVDLEHLSDTLGSTSPLRVKFNTGTGFTGWYTYAGALDYALRSNVTHSRSVGANAGVSIPLPFCAFLCSIDVGASYTYAHTLGGYSTMLADFDGDGYADHIYSDTSGNVSVSLNNHGRTNLLKTVHRPLGGRFDLDYARSGDTTEQPGNRWVLSKVSTYDGHSGDGDVVITPPPGETAPFTVTQVSTISYQGGKYDRAEREFYGFRTVTTSQLDPANNSVYRSVVSTYKNDNFYNRGLLESQVTQDGAQHKFTETDNTYDTVTVEAGRGGALEDFTATRFPRLISSDNSFYEGQSTAGKSTYATYVYDALGNVTQYVDAGDTGTQDDLTATITYSSCPATNVVGKAIGIVVTANGAEVRRRDASVDCATGNVTQVKQYLADGTFAQTDLNYFPDGNLQQVTGPANATGQRYQISYVYDPDVQSYIAGITDSFGYSSSSTYNLKYGQVATATDVNNNVTSYTYDQFGRVSTIRGPYEQSSPVPTIRFSYHPEGSTPWALTRHYDPYRDSTGIDTLDTVLFTDGFKRVLQTKKDGSVFTGQGTNTQDLMLVSGRVTFDFVGRAVKQYYPTTETLPTNAEDKGAFKATYDTITPTLMLYDVMDRTTQTTIPDGTSTSTTFGFGNDRSGTSQFEAIVEDANHIRTNTFKDVRGLITSVEEFHSSQPIWTSYAYDPMKELVSVTDDHSNVTHVGYDNLGRTTSEDNPDTGRTDMTYDLAGNLTAKTTADLRSENKQITYTYYYNRLTDISYPDFPGNNVHYSYGAPNAPDNRAGRITTVTDQPGSEDRYYGKLGELTGQVMTVNATNGPSPAVYSTSYVYDTWGRVQNMTYPDGEVLTYAYDSGGQPKQVSGAKGGISYDYVDRMEYDKFEQKVFMQQGNGIKTQYSYRLDNRRLSTLQAGQGQGNLFQNLSYTYDAVGNVLTLGNNVPVPPPSQYGGPTTQTFTYDDLYRLTNATGTYQFMTAKSRQYNTALQYDTIDNLLSKQQTDNVIQGQNQSIPQQKTTYSFSYAYTGTQPHAPTQIGDRTFTYDANGNQTGWASVQNGQRRNIVWDEENRAQSISDNGRQETYEYDAAGARVIKRGPQGETVYVNAYFTIRNGQIGTKNVYVGSDRIASKMVQHDAQTEERDRYFYHPDHLGSSNYVTDATGHVYEHMEYFAFGETWVQESSNSQRTPFLFTSKELDEETGLYYYGARYYDPRTSVWQSADPALPAYLRGKPNGGVFNPGNLAMYTYAMGSPVRFKDPNGLSPNDTKASSEQSGGLGVAFREYSGEMQGSLGGDPVTMTWENTLLSLEANWQNEDKMGPGVEGSFAKAAGQAFWGTKVAGVYGRYEATVIKGEARVCLNIPEAQLGVESSVSAAQAEVAFGVNFFGLSAGVKGEAALGILAEAEVGAEGVKVGLGPAGVGVEFGLAKGPGENPLSGWANIAQSLKDTEQAIGEYLTTVQMPDFTRVSLREMRDNDGD